MRRPRRRQLVWAAAALVLGLAGAAAWLAWKGGWVRTVYPVAGLRLEDGTVRVRKVLWGPPAPLAGTPQEASGPSQPRAVIVGLHTARGDLDLFLAGGAAGGSPAPLPGAERINSAHNEASACLDPGGATLYVSSDRPGGQGGFDLWRSRREAGGWSEPENLGPRVNSPYNERDPALGDGGTLLVFSTDRPETFLAAPPEDWGDIDPSRWPSASDDLAFSWPVRTASGSWIWSEARGLDALNSRASERFPAFSPDGGFVYFASDRAPGCGRLDVYRSRRLPSEAGLAAGDERFAFALASPENLGLPLNSTRDEAPLDLSDAGFSLLVLRWDETSQAPVVAQSRSREVEAEIEIASLPLAELGGMLGRAAALAGSTLALAVLVLVLVRTRRSWAVSLLTRCAVIAFLVHLGMLYGFYCWELGSLIIARAEKLRPEEPEVETSLAASISAEVNQPRIDIEDLDATAVEVERTPRADLSLAAATEPAAEPAVVPAAAARIEPVEILLPPDVATPPAPEDPAPSALDAVAEARALEPPRPAADLPLPPPLSPAPPDDPLPIENAARTIARLRPPDPAPTPQFSAERLAPQSAPVEMVQAAATSALAPVPTPLLPPLSPAEVRVVRAMSPLPVPTQSPEAAPEPSPAPSAAHVAVAPASPAPLAAEAPRLDLPQTPAALPLAASRWDSVAAALPPETAPLEADERFAAAPELPRMQAMRVSSRRPAVLDTAAIAERAQEGSSDVSAAAGPEPVQRQRPAPVPSAAPLASPVPAFASTPLSASPSEVPAPSSAALARLEPESRPGAELAPIAAPARSVSSRPPRLERLPQEGGRELADVVPAESDDAAEPWQRQDRSPRAEARPHEVAAGDASVEADAPAQAPPAVLAGGSAALEPRDLVASALQRPAAAHSEPTTPPAADGPLAALVQPAAPPSVQRSAKSALPESGPTVETIDPRDLRQVRSPEVRDAIVPRMGGSGTSEEAVRLALDWLARHQSPDGRWDVDGFDSSCGACRSPGFHKHCDSAVTGLVVLCFLGHDHTPGSQSPFAAAVRRGLDWLLSQQAPDGNLAGEDRQYTMYSHGIATLALSEAYLMTREPRYLDPVRRACALIVRAQNPQTGGWRYLPVPPERGDTSITGWQVMALKSAQGGGIEIPDEVFARTCHWFDKEVGGGDDGGLYGYISDYPPQIAMVAEGLFSRQVLGARRGDANIDEAARYLHTEMRDGKHLDNFYLLYYGTLALYQYQGWIWESWNRQVRDFLISKQRQKGPAAGSWDPRHKWSEGGGRVLTTAFATLSLEVYYRYLPLYWSPPAAR